MTMSWSALYLLREMGRQRREAIVAKRSVELARGTACYERALNAALRVLIEDCPLMWGEAPREVS